jgi:hypothetical protein
VLLTTASSFTTGQMPAPESMSRRVTIATVLHLDTCVPSGWNDPEEAFERQRAVRSLMGPSTRLRASCSQAMRAVCRTPTGSWSRCSAAMIWTDY